MVVSRYENELLLYHLKIMRDSVKKGLKKRYGRSEGKRLIEIYDEITEKVVNQLKNEQEKNVLEMDEAQKSFLGDFLTWYTNTLKNDLKPPRNENESLKTLIDMKNRLLSGGDVIGC